MNRGNKYYFLVERLLAMGLQGFPITPLQMVFLEREMDKRKINYHPTFFEKLVARINLWYQIESPWGILKRGDAKKYEGLARTTYSARFPKEKKT